MTSSTASVALSPVTMRLGRSRMRAEDGEGAGGCWVQQTGVARRLPAKMSARARRDMEEIVAEVGLRMVGLTQRERACPECSNH